MYKFIFYFFYMLFLRLRVRDPSFTSVLWTCIIISIHILAGIKMLVLVKLLDEFPTFSTRYSQSKFYWALPFSVVFVFVFLYFTKKRREEIVEKHRNVDFFFTTTNIFMFLATIIIPIVLFSIHAKLPE